MQKKAFVVLAISACLFGMPMHAQQIAKSVKDIGSLTGKVPSAFSHVAPVALVSADVLGRKVLAAQVSLRNMTYISSAELFTQVQRTPAMHSLPAKELKALELKFAQLDLSVESASNKQLGYLGALWETLPAVEAGTLMHPLVAQMTQLLDLQRYMSHNDNTFPHVFSVAQGGWLLATSCLTSVEGNHAFLNVVNLLVKEQANQANPVVMKQLVALHAGAQNQVPVQQVVEQLKNWREANSAPAGFPTLPKSMDGVSLGMNAESLWLATEIRLLQLTPGIELPEILQTAKVSR